MSLLTAGAPRCMFACAYMYACMHTFVCTFVHACECSCPTRVRPQGDPTYPDRHITVAHMVWVAGGRQRGGHVQKLEGGEQEHEGPGLASRSSPGDLRESRTPGHGMVALHVFESGGPFSVPKSPHLSSPTSVCLHVTELGASGRKWGFLVLPPPSTHLELISPH